MPLVNAELTTPPDDRGYSCVVWFSIQVSRTLFGQHQHRIWFSMAFNPTMNVDSSNPCEIYRSVSRAVLQGDIRSRIIHDYRIQLLTMVRDERAAGNLSASDALEYKRIIKRQTLEYFQPQIWMLDLPAIARRKYGQPDVVRLKDECRNHAADAVSKNPNQVLQPDEYLILDLQPNEYEAVIIG